MPWTIWPEEKTRQAWPEGVIARYLTVGGATVDLTETGPRDAPVLASTIARCIGCGEDRDVWWRDGFYDYRDEFHSTTRAETVERSEAVARRWAQEHAERCRAMPKPSEVAQ